MIIFWSTTITMLVDKRASVTLSLVILCYITKVRGQDYCAVLCV